MSTPVWIGRDKQLSFGWYHAAHGDQRRCGVVLCNPLGYESMCTHRSYRVLAEALANAGFPVVRFDYHGTGDSAGKDTDPHRLAAWKESINEAVYALRRNSGVGEVSIFGVRCGGTLGMSVAAERADVKAVIAWAPFLSGKAYVRELRAFNMIKGATAHHGIQDLEAAGFLLPAEAVADLSNLDLTKLEKPPAQDVFLLQRDSASNEEKIQLHFSKLGAAVTLAHVPGYEEMMRDPHEASVPHTVIAHVVDWLIERFPERAGLGITGPFSLSSHDLGEVTEQPLFFGPDAKLFGVLTSTDKWVRSRPAVIVLNTGSNHHVGSHRMSVALARTWGKLGFVCLRFDITGVGDSVMDGEMRGKRLYDPRSVADVHAAIAVLRASLGIEEFILVGLCSGAYLAFHSTLLTPSVVGQLLINPQPVGFPISGVEDRGRYALKSNRHYKALLLKFETYERLVTGEINVKRIARVLAGRVAVKLKNSLRGFAFAKDDRPRNAIDAGFFTIADRCADTFVVFSGDDSGFDQMREMLGERQEKLEARENYRATVLAGADHTFSRSADRRELIAMLVKHVNDRFGATTQGAQSMVTTSET
ncbi:MAG: alpha/beta fold hydrolase [Clostridia bacterium]|nr:alpha/beta fold hydrolase [Deltaproteobacteria bacterium]